MVPATNQHHMLSQFDQILATPGTAPKQIQTRRGEGLILRDPECTLKVLLDQTFVRQDLLSMAFGNGIVFIEGSSDCPRRSTLSKQFNKRFVASFFALSVEVFEEHIERWQKEEATLNLHTELNRITLEVITRIVLGRPLGEDFEPISEAFRVGIFAMGKLSKLAVSDDVELSPTFQRDVSQVSQAFDAFLYPIIQEYRQPGAADQTICSVLVEAGFEDKAIRDELVSLLLAGSETTALVLSWSLLEIDRRPELMASLRAEVDQVVGETFSQEDLPRLILVRSVLEDTMRLYPPVWHMIRSASTDVELEGRSVRKSTMVTVSPYMVHRSPAHWENPFEFSPRPSSVYAAEERRGAYIPFGLAHHVCLGRRAGMVESTVLLALMMKHVELEFATQDVPLSEALTLRPNEPIKVRIRNRTLK